MKKLLFYVLAITSQIFLSLFGQETIDVHVQLNQIHSVGGISEFDRSKFITVHLHNREADWDTLYSMMDYLMNDLDVYFGRGTGDISNSLSPRLTPEDYISNGNGDKREYAGDTVAHKYEARQDLVVALQELALRQYYPLDSNYRVENGIKLGTDIGNYLTSSYGEGGTDGMPKPNYVEVVNEPLWAYIDLWKLHGEEVPKEPEIIEGIFDIHNRVANEIRQVSPETMIGGFTTAFPDLEVDNFNRWEQRWKKFIDDCGSSMDFYSFHLYDFPGIHYGKKMFRKGGNMEATMDMIAHYNYITYGDVKPFLISEYGSQVHDWYNEPWSPYRDWLIVKAFSSMMMQFMDRPDGILKAIPFAMLKARWGWTDVPYFWRLMRKENEPGDYSGKWIWTDIIKFYQLWADVNGVRGVTRTSDLDLQVDTYISNNKAYLILNNIDFQDVAVNLNINSAGNNIEKVFIKHLQLVDSVPVLDSIVVNNAPGTVTVGAEATMILEYTFSNEIVQDTTIYETKYFAESYKRPIVAGNGEEFAINDIEIRQDGHAILRLGIGRGHGLSLSPEVKINGSEVIVPTDFRGDDQKDRGTFFGMLEIPVPYILLQYNNIVSVKFPDEGGFITSAALRIFGKGEETTSTDNVYQPLTDIKIYPNPATDDIYIGNIREGNYNISILDVTGVTQFKYNDYIMEGMQVPINDLRTGYYILIISDGESYFRQPFSKL